MMNLKKLKTTIFKKKEKSEMQEIYRKIGVFLHAVKVKFLLTRYHVKRHFHFNIKLSEIGTIGEQLKYGHVAGGEVMVEAQWGASEVIKAASGKFVQTDDSGYLEIADSGDNQLIGWANHREETIGAVDGVTKTQLNVSLSAVYKIPLNTSTPLTRAMFYDSCDLLVTTDIQGVDCTSSEDVLIIVGGDIANQKWALVMLNPSKMGAQGIS